jgi:hypothetical protein
LIVELCSEAPKNIEQIRIAVQAEQNQGDGALDAVSGALADLTAKRVLYEERGRYFTLAIPEHQFI